MPSFTLDPEQYEALVAFAQRSTVNSDGSVNQQQANVLNAFLLDIERTNGIIRSSLWIRWQDPVAPLPPGVSFPASWPPTLQYFLQFISRPIARADVQAVVDQRTPKAVNIMVTPDPAALVGWSTLDQFFVQP